MHPFKKQATVFPRANLLQAAVTWQKQPAQFATVSNNHLGWQAQLQRSQS